MAVQKITTLIVGDDIDCLYELKLTVVEGEGAEISVGDSSPLELTKKAAHELGVTLIHYATLQGK